MCNFRKWGRITCGNNESARLITHFNRLTDLNETQRDAIRLRYIHILEEFSWRCTRYSVLYHIGHLIITVGSLIVPALLSVQYTSSDVNIIPTANMQANIYWLTWSLSLLVTMFNGILVLYKVDKKYYFLHTTRERLRSEGWQFIQLTGRYAGGLLQYRVAPSHKNQLVFFCHNVEKIRMRQIEEEYYKNEETNQTTSIQTRNIQGTNTNSVNSTGTGTGGGTERSSSVSGGNGGSGTGLSTTTNVPTGQVKELYPPTFSDDIDRFFGMTEQQFKDSPPSLQAMVTALIRAGGAINNGSKVVPMDASGNDLSGNAVRQPVSAPSPRSAKFIDASAVALIPRPSLQPSTSALPPSQQFSIDTTAVADQILRQAIADSLMQQPVQELGTDGKNAVVTPAQPLPPSPPMSTIPEEEEGDGENRGNEAFGNERRDDMGVTVRAGVGEN